MSYLVMLCHIQILENCSRSDDTVFQLFYSKSLQILGFEVLQQFFAGGSFCKNPVIQFECEEFVAEISFEHWFFTPFEQNLFRAEIIQKFVYIISRTFGCHELSGRDVKKCYSTCGFPEVYSCKEVVLLVRQDIVADGYSRCNQFGNTSFHQFLGGFRVFQLVADGYSSSGTNQFG